MVKLRRLTQRVNRHFHHPHHGFGGGPVLQTNGLFEQVSVVGRFLAYQILPIFTNFYQKCVAKGVRRASKRQLTGGFSRAIYLNRVKSGGSCQAIIGDGRRVRPALPEGSCDGKSRLRRGRRPHRKSAPRSAEGGMILDFARTEATDLLKTKGGPRDRTQYKPISRRSALGGRQLAVGTPTVRPVRWNCRPQTG